MTQVLDSHHTQEGSAYSDVRAKDLPKEKQSGRQSQDEAMRTVPTSHTCETTAVTFVPSLAAVTRTWPPANDVPHSPMRVMSTSAPKELCRRDGHLRMITARLRPLLAQQQSEQRCPGLCTDRAAPKELCRRAEVVTTSSACVMSSCSKHLWHDTHQHPGQNGRRGDSKSSKSPG